MKSLKGGKKVKKGVDSKNGGGAVEERGRTRNLGAGKE